MNSRIYFGDSREVLPGLIDEFGEKITLMVTSPPYYVGRGYEDYLISWIDYWEMIEEVLGGVSSLIQPFGKIAINYADKYANSKEFGRPLEICYATHYSRIMSNHDLWARIIWNKNRLPDGARHVTQKSRFEGQMRVAPDWEYIFVWRKRGEGKPPKKEVDMTKEQWKDYMKGIWDIDPVRRNPRIGNTKLALFPIELPRRLIQMYTQPGDIIIDPFVGTGTTVKIARMLGRVGIGIEKNVEMRPTLEVNLQPDMFTEDVVQFIDWS